MDLTGVDIDAEIVLCYFCVSPHELSKEGKKYTLTLDGHCARCGCHVSTLPLVYGIKIALKTLVPSIALGTINRR
jgi:hypothetical protein